MRSLLAFALLLAYAFSACAAPPFGPRVHIDWIDFVKVDAIEYLAQGYGIAAPARAGRPLTDDDLGPVHARVRFKLQGNVNDPKYRSKDGDAAFLEAGTPLHRVKGYAPSFRLGAKRGGEIVLYEAFQNPKAKTGQDLLDIRDRVKAIAVLSEQDASTELGRIVDTAVVGRLVDLVLASPVNQERRSPYSPEDRRYFLAFELTDGTRTTRAFIATTGELVRGISVPEEFGRAIEGAVQR